MAAFHPVRNEDWRSGSRRIIGNRVTVKRAGQITKQIMDYFIGLKGVKTIHLNMFHLALVCFIYVSYLTGTKGKYAIGANENIGHISLIGYFISVDIEYNSISSYYIFI